MPAPPTSRPPTGAARRGRRTPEGAIRVVRYWLPVMSALLLLVGGLLLFGLLTGAWDDEPKNAARWFGVVTAIPLGVAVAWVRVLAMREIRSGRYPRPASPEGRAPGG